MYPLLVKDQLTVPYAVMQLLFVLYATHYMYHYHSVQSRLVRYSVMASFVGAVLIHIAALVMPVIPRYPDIVTYLFVSYAAAHFFLFLLTLYYFQYREQFAAAATPQSSPFLMPTLLTASSSTATTKSKAQ